MLGLTGETQNLGRVESENSQQGDSITSASKSIRIVRSRVYKDEAFVLAGTGGTASSFGIPRKLSRAVKLGFSIAIYGALRFVIVTARKAGAVLIAPTILLDLSRVWLYSA